MTPKIQYLTLMRAIRMTAFMAKNPLREARAIVAASAAEQFVRKD